METRFFKSRFSTHFNRLTYLGMWSSDMLSDPVAKKLFFVYRLLCAVFLIVAIAFQMIDLYFVFGNLRRITYNFCTSIIVIAIAIKVILLYDRKTYLNELRLSLWQDSLKFNSQEEIAIQDFAYTQLKNIRNCFYIAAVIFLPVWVISSYFSYKWGPRQLAFAAYLPMSDPLNDLVYVPALTYQLICGFYVIFLVIEVDLAMLSIVLQMEAYYQILITNILKLNEIYGEETDERNNILTLSSIKVEVNVHLKKQSAQRMLKLLIIRQLEILRYSKNFEHIYSRCLIIQVIAGSLLVVMNGLELSLFLHELNMKLCFQSGYIILIMVDILYICYHLSRLSAETYKISMVFELTNKLFNRIFVSQSEVAVFFSQVLPSRRLRRVISLEQMRTDLGPMHLSGNERSLNVGNAAYSTVWYKMDSDIRKSLCMIIIRSQMPPKITAGKLFLMDLNTYLHMLRNIYSWLMLFRQLGVK